MPLLPCTLVHHTGTIVRFTTSQLPQLPDVDRDITLELPSGHIVSGHFRCHPANPNISGKQIVRYIKQRLRFGETAPALIEISGDFWRLYKIADALTVARREHVSTARVRIGGLTGTDLTRLLARADRFTQAAQRKKVYARLLRPPALRRMILQLIGLRCQVGGCTATEDMEREWADPAAGWAVVEVHHIEAMAHRVDHHPRNLCVLCANHHRLIHGFGPWEIQHSGDDVILSKSGRSIRIVRDLAFLQ